MVGGHATVATQRTSAIHSGGIFWARRLQRILCLFRATRWECRLHHQSQSRRSAPLPINGSIEEAGLPDVLQLLSLGGKTGCLSISDGQTHGEIYLDAGRVSWAEVFSQRDQF